MEKNNIMEMDLDVANGKDESVEITLKGKPEAVIQALVNGLPREALLQLNEAFAREMEKRGLPVSSSPTRQEP